jgi:holo-[acyl-carrier protein] synthase
MIGVDIVKISRLYHTYLLLAKRLLSSKENFEMNKRPSEKDKAVYVASRFAAKEAYIKASNNKSAKYDEIETLDDADGRPHLYYQGKETGEISLSHDGYAVAFVILSR